MVFHFASHSSHEHVVVDPVDEFLQVNIHDPLATVLHETLDFGDGLVG